MLKATRGAEVKATAEAIYQAMEGKGGLKDVFFVACGGSLAAYYSAYYLLRTESKNVDAQFMTANEFVYATPARVNENAVVVAMSLSGTPETIEAAKKAKELGATTVVLTVTKDSPLVQYGDYSWIYGSQSNDAADSDGVVDKETSGEALCLRFGFELLRLYDNYEFYDKAVDGFDKLDETCRKIAKKVRLRAKKFGEDHKDDPIIYTLGTGPSLGEAYIESICMFMEMEWIHSFCFNSGELFHGPFECVDFDTPYVIFLSEGKTRPMDERALRFLQKHSGRVTQVDARELGVSIMAPEVEEYFSGLINGVLSMALASAIASAKMHPIPERRYMHRFDY
ncbi:MAG: SIS domain-containing protein [Oscillospiraceae bacterium]|nr:SIS domain-containing protein [Oscillospiraceae bacterium]